MAALIGCIIPDTAQCGDPVATYTVWGSGFVSGITLITVDGVNYPTVFVSANQLTTIGVDPSLRTQPGYVKVGVTGDTRTVPLHFTPHAVHMPNAANPTRSNWYDVTP